MEKSCKDIAEILIDYADGLLAPGQSERVAEHLTGCTACRELLKNLQKSLELAEVIWDDNAAEIEKIAAPKVPAPPRRTWLRYVAAAASIVVIGAICLTQLAKEPPVEPPLTFEEIERKISDAASAARLLATAELLAQHEDFKDLVQQQYRYIIERHSESPSVEKTELKL
jgi:anti-sigma factor RsiW